MSFAVSAITIQGAGVIGSAFGARSAAAGQKAGLGFKAEMSQINALMDERAAQSLLLTSQRMQSRALLKGAQVKASQRVNMAANGIDLGGSDTATRLLASTEFMRQSDALTISQNYTEQAENWRMKKVMDEGEGRMYQAAADAINPDAAFASTLIQGAGSVATNWYMMSKAGAFGGGSNNYKLDFGSASPTIPTLKGPSTGYWSKP